MGGAQKRQFTRISEPSHCLTYHASAVCGVVPRGCPDSTALEVGYRRHNGGTLHYEAAHHSTRSPLATLNRDANIWALPH